MARTFPLGTLVTRCKQRCDMVNQDLIGDPEWKGLISSAYGELYSILVASGHRYFEAVQSITTDGTAAYPLEKELLSFIRCDRVLDSAGRRRALNERMVQEYNRTAGISGSNATEYALVGPNLELYPTPPSGQTYELVYIPQPLDLSEQNDSTTIDVVTPDGEVFLVEHVAVKALLKEESDAREAMAERERARARVEEWAVVRAFNNPRRPVVDDYDSPYDDEWRYWR